MATHPEEGGRLSTDAPTFIFCRINLNYWTPLVGGVCKASMARDLRAFHRQWEPGTHEISSSQLTPHFPDVRFQDCPYFLLVHDEYIAWRPYQPLGWLSKTSNREIQLTSLAHEVDAQVQRFHREHLQGLRAVLNDPASGAEEIAAAICGYLFYEHFSIWFYSRVTRTFTLLCASFAPEKTFVSINAPDSTLGTTLKATTPYTEKTVEAGRLHSKPLKRMRTAIRLRVDLRRKASSGARPEDQSLALFCFYSPFEDFFLLPAQKGELNVGALTIVHGEQTIFTERSTELLESVLESHQPGDLVAFLNTVCRSVTEKCGWEAASILLIDDHHRPSKLVLTAASSPPGTSPTIGAAYDLTKAGKTVSVLRDKQPKFSYDLAADPHNTHGIDDPTASPPQNWLGLPILRGTTAVGVIRAKNKCRDSHVVAFNDLDISLLRHFAEISAYVYGIEADAASERHRQQEIRDTEKAQLERETQLRKQLEKTNEHLTDFITTFQHELKSPLTIFSQIRERLARSLRVDGLLVRGQPLPKRLRELCEDSESLAGRLAFVTNSMELQPADLVREARRCECFKEIVAPILTFAGFYARNRSLTIQCTKQTLFMPVFCDPMAASLALHTLIDNAIKYADPGTVITIKGTPRADTCTITVTNVGLPILPHERERIFEKYVRGDAPKRQKIGGAGIGLHLAREIMQRNNGTVSLVSIANPVAFDLVIGSV